MPEWRRARSTVVTLGASVALLAGASASTGSPPLGRTSPEWQGGIVDAKERVKLPVRYDSVQRQDPAGGLDQSGVPSDAFLAAADIAHVSSAYSFTNSPFDHVGGTEQFNVMTEAARDQAAPPPEVATYEVGVTATYRDVDGEGKTWSASASLARQADGGFGYANVPTTPAVTGPESGSCTVGFHRPSSWGALFFSFDSACVPATYTLSGYVTTSNADESVRVTDAFGPFGVTHDPTALRTTVGGGGMRHDFDRRSRFTDARAPKTTYRPATDSVVTTVKFNRLATRRDQPAQVLTFAEQYSEFPEGRDNRIAFNESVVAQVRIPKPGAAAYTRSYGACEGVRSTFNERRMTVTLTVPRSCFKGLWLDWLVRLDAVKAGQVRATASGWIDDAAIILR